MWSQEAWVTEPTHWSAGALLARKLDKEVMG